MTRAADLFAGWGGFTLGAEEAGIDVVWAANHWGLAVEAHALNHPRTTHVCQDLNQANFYDVPDIEVLIAGPACPGFSQAAQPARKSKPAIRGSHDKLRSNAWAVVECTEAKLPALVVTENVPQFSRWKLFPVWDEAFRILGYSTEYHVLRASHFGVPQRRDRLFHVAVRGSTPLGLAFEQGKEPPIGPELELFSGDWTAVSDGSLNVRGRIAKARARGLGEVFLTQHVTGHPGVPLTEPIRTITTKDQWAIVRGSEYRPLTVRENARAMGFPDSYEWPEHATRGDLIKGLGNAVSPKVATRLLSEALRRI